jgi:protein-disulfide isomerase
LDTATFNQCLESDATAAIVQADEDEAANLGLPGTPSFFINGKALRVQSLDLSQFTRAFDALAK